jgi:YYY domain-containing protein
MSETIRWWLVLQLVGAATLPLCLLAFRRLPDRGYALSKPFGLILLGFTFWFFSTDNWIPVLPNSAGGIVGAMFVLAVISAVAAYLHLDDMIAWVRAHWRYIVGVEVALFVVFALAVSLRAVVGQISGTEQPMDLMFLNSTIRAEHFPPEDPWLFGHTVAYYYFGYLIVGMMTQLSGVAADVGYNIGLAMIAALTLLGGFGIVYNLISAREGSLAVSDTWANPGTPPNAAMRARAAQQPKVSAVADTLVMEKPAPAPTVAPAKPRSATPAAINWKAPVFGVAGALMLVVMGNLVWLFVFASAYGIGGSGFYNWVDVSGLTANEPRTDWYPSDFFGFFNASRIYPINNDDYRAITEFPMFSFLLGDMHPHVMALPFVLLVVALALTLFRSDVPLDITFWFKRPLLLIGAAIMIGGLAFINTWDIATMAFVVVVAALVANFAQMRASGAWAVREPRTAIAATNELSADALMTLGIVAVVHLALLIVLLVAMRPSPVIAIGLIAVIIKQLACFAWYLSRPRWPFGIELAVRTVSFALPMLLLAIDLYLPFYTSFSSQADGIGAVVTRSGITEPGTRPFHLLLFWGPLFVVVLPFVAARLLALRDRLNTLVYAIAAIPGLAVIAGWVIFFGLQKATDSAKLEDAGGLFAQVGDRGSGWLTAIFLAAMLTAALAALWGELSARNDARTSRSSLFALLLTCVALLLVLGTEFFYVGDVFNNRMNTVFKLYYQAWLLLALAGGFALYYVASHWRLTFEGARTYRMAWAAGVVLVLLGAALYPLGGTYNRTEGDPWRRGDYLHGLAYYSAGERAGIDWLNERADGQDVVIAEAVGNDYTMASRISAATGIPTIVGWVGHENQWRGSIDPYAGRFEDVEKLYRTQDINEARQILQKYGVTYVYVGQLEQQQYASSGGLAKFEGMPVMFQSGEVTIYRATGLTGEAGAAQ